MLFTYKGTSLPAVLLMVEPGHTDPREAIKGVSFYPGHILSDKEVAEFVEENHKILSETCAQVEKDFTDPTAH